MPPSEAVNNPKEEHRALPAITRLLQPCGLNLGTSVFETSWEAGGGVGGEAIRHLFSSVCHALKKTGFGVPMVRVSAVDPVYRVVGFVSAHPPT